jgi:hypothetical protein
MMEYVDIDDLNSVNRLIIIIPYCMSFSEYVDIDDPEFSQSIDYHNPLLHVFRLCLHQESFYSVCNHGWNRMIFGQEQIWVGILWNNSHAQSST